MNTFNVWAAAVASTSSLVEATKQGWVLIGSITVPEWHHFNGTSMSYQRMIMRKAKAACRMTYVHGTTERCGEDYIFRPYRQNTILSVAYVEP